MIQLSRTTIKSVFIFFLIYLPLQYLWIGIAGVVWSEPWPSFALPGFKNVYVVDGYTQIQKPFFYVQVEETPGKSLELEVSEYKLFDGLQPSQLQGFFRTHFSEPKSLSTEAKQWLQHQIELVYGDPGTKARGLKVVWKQITYRHIGDSLLVDSQKKMNQFIISFDD